MRKLIINADDLGMSHEQNDQILQCIELGVITSSTLMANGPFFEEGVKIAKQYPQISVGVHLNIIEFAPLTNAEVFRKHGMLDADGNFIEGAAFVVPMNEELKQAVFEEWDAQISKVEEAGITPSHCDSHEHAHTRTELAEVLCRVLDKHQIRRVRRRIIPSIRVMLRAKQQPASVHYDKSKAVKTKKRSVIYRRLHLFVVKYKSWQWNRQMRRKYILTDAFYSFREFYSFRNILHLGGKSSVVELMCHPGNKPFQKETDNLMNAKSWMSDDFQLTNYNQL